MHPPRLARPRVGQKHELRADEQHAEEHEGVREHDPGAEGHEQRRPAEWSWRARSLRPAPAPDTPAASEGGSTPGGDDTPEPDSSGSADLTAGITVHNGTDKAIDAMGISSTVQSGGKQADSVFDSAQNIEIPSGKIQPGKDLTFDVVYQVADPSDISFDLSIIDPDSLDTHEVTFVS